MGLVFWTLTESRSWRQACTRFLIHWCELGCKTKALNGLDRKRDFVLSPCRRKRAGLLVALVWSHGSLTHRRCSPLSVDRLRTNSAFGRKNYALLTRKICICVLHASGKITHQSRSSERKSICLWLKQVRMANSFFLVKLPGLGIHKMAINNTSRWLDTIVPCLRKKNMICFLVFYKMSFSGDMMPKTVQETQKK